ncbi:MAG: SusD/RagB family nutrient-binding outer membrane lipoprotein [Dinghuibacter sp.]|nr:SusD/RagB family nutrient-binding outer membrane lipoprotein [Dinghuibacter sp.]
MKYNKFLFVAVLVGSLGVSCKKDFFDINQNPNQPVTSNITADLILPAALTQVGQRITGGTATGGTPPGLSFGWLNRWMGYWAPSASWAPNNEENSYNISTSFGSSVSMWNNWYNILFDLDQMTKRAKLDGQQFYEGIGKITMALLYHQLVDVFGNVPYSKALSNGPGVLPEYDKGSDIYPKLIAQITDGINLIKAADVSKNFNIGATDIMFHADKVKWAKFGNTLKLRLLIHQSQVPGFNPAADISAINSEGSGFLNAGETAGTNPGYTNDKPNPFWATWGYALNGDKANTYDRANNFALNLMKNLNDVRHQYFYRPVRTGTFAGQYRGIDYALINADPALTEANTSDIGGNTPGGTSFNGLLKSPTMDCWVLTSFESIFLQAEALARGWPVNTAYASAQAAYNEAVKESFRWLNVGNSASAANTAATTYLAQADARIAWPATQTAQINVILWQKYFALNGSNPLETWTDYRRIPAVNVPLSTAPRVANAIPVRMQYPQDEYNYNAANVQAQGTINQFTSNIFWDR